MSYVNAVVAQQREDMEADLKRQRHDEVVDDLEKTYLDAYMTVFYGPVIGNPRKAGIRAVIEKLEAEADHSEPALVRTR